MKTKELKLLVIHNKI